MAKINIELEMAKEVERIYRESKDYRTAYKKVVEMYKKAQTLPTKIKGLSSTQKLQPTVL